MTKKIKLLLVCGRITNGGVGSFISKILKNINLENFDVHVSYYKCDQEGLFQKNLKQMDSRIKVHVLSPLSIKNLLNFTLLQEAKILYQENKFDVMHSHSPATSFFDFFYAKKYKVLIRILHSHSTKFSENKLKAIRNNFLYSLSKAYITNRLACGNKAGKFLFKKKTFTVIHNAIECDKFKFNENYFTEIRNEFKIPFDAFVLGHVSNFEKVKNHKFIINIFNEVYKKNKNSYLLLVGNGETLQEVQAQVKKLNIEKQVIFAGLKSDVYKFYSAMDCFVFPSFFEGLGIVLIEAQTSGLSSIISQNVPNEVMISDIIKQIPLSNQQKWLDHIQSIKEKKYDRKLYCKIIKNAGYDIVSEGKVLENYYISKSEA